MPTDNTVQTSPAGSAGGPPAGSTQPALTEEFLRSIPYDLLKKIHPDVQNVETRYAAAHKEIDGKKTKKELEAEVARLKVLAGEDSTPPPIAPSAALTDMAKMQAEIEWNIANKSLIQAGGQTYVDLLNRGYDKQDALDLSLARRPNADKTFAENLRAEVSASAGGGTDRTPVRGPVVDGIPKEYIQKMQAQFPNLPEDKLLDIIRRSKDQSQMRGV